MLEWDDVDLGADFLQNPALFGIQCVLIVIAALDVNIGRSQFEETGRTHVWKYRDQINAFQCGYDFRPITFAVHRTTGSLQFANRLVAIDSYNERVAKRASCIQIADMSDVKQIEAAVCGHQFFSGRAQIARPLPESF